MTTRSLVLAGLLLIGVAGWCMHWNVVESPVHADKSLLALTPREVRALRSSQTPRSEAEIPRVMAGS